MPKYICTRENAGFLNGHHKPGDVIDVSPDVEKADLDEKGNKVLKRYFEKVEEPAAAKAPEPEAPKPGADAPKTDAPAPSAQAEQSQPQP